GRPMHPNELGGHACITFEGLMSSTQWVFAEGKTVLSIPVHSRLVVSTAEAAIDAAVADLGVTRVIAYQVAGRCREGTLESVLQDFESNTLPINMLHAGQGRLPLKVRAFIDFTRPRLRTRLLEG
ncbi:MAG TPA: LysR substrate-binding domain-containing protein, partial [Rhodanobacter sp.]